MSKPTYEELEATVTNLTAQVQGLAAENAELKKFCKNASFDADYEAELAMEHGGFTDALNDIKTPDTDAALAEIRAQGVDAFAADLGNAYQQLRSGSPQAKALKGVVFRAAHFSEQLRKEQGK